MRLMFDVCLLQGSLTLQAECSCKERSLHWGLLRIFYFSALCERGRIVCYRHKFVGEGQHIKNSKPPANRSLTVSERVPGKTYPRLEVAARWIQEIGIAKMRILVGDA